MLLSDPTYVLLLIIIIFTFVSLNSLKDLLNLKVTIKELMNTSNE